MPFSLLIKPVSADCNLRCSYCFYLPKADLYPETDIHRMSDEVLERLISAYMGTEQPQHIFGWQGGEPTLMGVDFFRKVVQFQQKYGKRGAVVGNALQTNATLITPEFAAHLAEYRFLMGVSIDGPAPVHDGNRKTINGKGSHQSVWRGMERLTRKGVVFNVLILVNSANVKRGREVYGYLRDHGLFYHQYIPCVEFDEQGMPLPYSIHGPDWGDFLCEIFDEWFQNDVGRVSVRLFDSILEYLVHGVHNVCHMKRSCNEYFLVEYNGDVYPCDFFAEPDLKIGNIMEDSWAELRQSKIYRAFGRQKARWNELCGQCRYVKICAGDCLKHRMSRNGDSERLSWLCDGWLRFYDHSMDRFKRLALQIKRQS